MPDVIVTGLPRSGLTLAAALIDSLPNSVCLNSPQIHGAQARKLQESIPFAKWLAGDFIWQRSRLASEAPVNDYRAMDGSALLDGLNDPRTQRNADGSPKLSNFVRKGLKGDFILGMKHDSLYTCMLPTIVQMEHFKIIAIIRHPYDVISSWQSLPNELIGQGKLPFARSYWPEAALIDPDAEIKLLDRMVQMYEFFMQRYHEYRQHMTIIKYEEMVDNPALVSAALNLDMVPLAASQIKPNKRIRKADELTKMRDLFRKYGVYTRYFYSDMQ
jgi:hypothetical protein